MEIRYNRAAIKALMKMPSNTARLIRSKIEQYASDPESMANNVKKLQGRDGYRLRVGDWRVIFDRNGVVLDILVQERRDQAAAERFLRRVLDGEGGTEPRVVITDKLTSYPPAIKRVLPTAEHRRHKRLNNRAENSHLPTRKRERVLQRFKSAEHAQRFLGPFSAVFNHFRPRRHRLTASAYRQLRTHAHIARQDVTQAGAWH